MEGKLPPYLSVLNPEQLAAVRHEGGSLLILAGAGSGKTRVITTKIAYLVRERGVEPESILAVTFTNKAAREMRDRAAAIEAACSRAVMRTFHSFGAWFLRRNAAAAGLDPNFTIYDDDDQTTLLHGAMPQNTRTECSRMVQAISRAKDLGLEPDSPDLSAAFSDPGMRRVYALYEERLRKTGNVDFGDLIRLPARLLREDEAVRRRTRQRFRVILVDEYQDSNVAQFELLRLLAAGERRRDAYLCVVGDDDQSIYRFRGAEVRNILRFPEIFPGTEIIKLERNYRSYQSILDVAGEVVSHNAGQARQDAGGRALGRREAPARPPRGPGRGSGLLRQGLQGARGGGGQLERRRHPLPHQRPVPHLREGIPAPAHTLPHRRSLALLRPRGGQGRPRLPGPPLQPARRGRLQARRQQALARHRRDERRRPPRRGGSLGSRPPLGLGRGGRRPPRARRAPASRISSA